MRFGGFESGPNLFRFLDTLQQTCVKRDESTNSEVRATTILELKSIGLKKRVA